MLSILLYASVESCFIDQLPPCASAFDLVKTASNVQLLASLSKVGFRIRFEEYDGLTLDDGLALLEGLIDELGLILVEADGLKDDDGLMLELGETEIDTLDDGLNDAEGE